MAFCLFKLKNSLIKKTSFAICSTRLATSRCFACQLESVNGHGIAIARATSTAVQHKLYNEQLHVSTLRVTKHHPRASPAVGMKGHEGSAVRVGLSELLCHDPLTILLNSRLQIFEDVSALSRLFPEDAAGMKATPKESLKQHHHNHHHYSQPSVKQSHSLNCTELHQDFPPLSSTSISCKSFTNPVAITDFPCASVGSHFPGSYSGFMLASPSPTTRDECSPTNAPDGDNPHGLPSEDKLQRMHDVLVKSLSEFFSTPLDYSYYDRNIIFENRFRGTVTKGLSMYAVQMALLKMVGHLKHAAIKLDIIKTTVHPEEGTIKVRWRIKGIRPTKAFSSFWVRKWRLSEIQRNDSSNWYDGFSTFHVNNAGLVSRHVADNMMPDDDKLGIRTKAGIFAKMAAVLGLMPRPAAGHSSVIQEFPSLF